MKTILITEDKELIDKLTKEFPSLDILDTKTSFHVNVADDFDCVYLVVVVIAYHAKSKGWSEGFQRAQTLRKTK